MNLIGSQEDSKKSWIILGVAIALAAIAAWLSSYYLESREQQIKESLIGEKEVKIAVIVPKVPVGPGDVVSGNNMVIREIPKKYLPDGAFKPSQFENLVGRTILSDISPGRPLLENSISGIGIEQFSDLLEEGHRAITITIDDLNSNSGMLVAGDRIDLFLLAKKSDIHGKEKNKGEEESEALYLLIENAVVLATGKITVDDKDTDAYLDDIPEQYNAITLGVKLKDAGRVGLAKEKGKFVTMLRNRQDSKKVKNNFIDDSELFQSVVKKEKKVEFIIGGKGKGGVADVQQQNIKLQEQAKKLNQVKNISKTAQALN